MTKKFILIFMLIISVISIKLVVKYEKDKYVSGAQNEVYHIYKDEDEENNTNVINDITIMSYNIHRGRDEDEKYTLEEMINFFEESDIDIIALQEVLFSHHTLLRDIEGYTSQYVANIDSAVLSMGVATYSKYPIIESNHVILSSKTEPRGALHTVYKINQKNVNVINVHLGLDKNEREMEIEELLRYCENLEGEIILVGDFNEENIEIDAFIDVGKYHGYKDYDTFFKSNARIDYIFTKTKDMYSTTYSVVNNKLSDHYPITTKIRDKNIYKKENQENLNKLWLKFKNKLRKTSISK